MPTDLKTDTTVKNYFYREDGLAVHETIYEFVKNVLSQFYTCPEDIERDFELAAWIEDLQSAWGGQIKGLTATGKITDLLELIELVTDIIFRMTVEHSIGNHGQWDYFGFTPNVPGIVITQETVVDALPPQCQTLNQISITHLLSNTDTGLPSLTSTPYRFENDLRLGPFVDNLRQSLNKIGESIQMRNDRLTCTKPVSK
eukprot:gene6097-7062_t